MPVRARSLALPMAFCLGLCALLRPASANEPIPTPTLNHGKAQTAVGAKGNVTPSSHILIATLYYWYRYTMGADGQPDIPRTQHIFQYDPVINQWEKALSDEFPEYWNGDPTIPFRSIVDWANPEWYELELRDMASAKIDIAMLAFTPSLPLSVFDTPTIDFPAYRGVRVAAEAARALQAEGAPCPKLGLYWDTGGIAGFDLTTGFTAADYTESAQTYTYSKNAWGAWLQVREFFRALGDTPAEREAVWGTVDGRPIIAVYARYGAKSTQQFWNWLSDQFLAEFGVQPYIALHESWMTGNDGNPIRMDGTISWNAAIYGPADQTPLYGGDRIVGIGPGFDSSVQEGRFGDALRPREDGYRGAKNPTGNYYDYSWQTALAMDPKIIHIETWNERHEGTGICRTALWDDAYIKQTAIYADIFHAGQTVPKTTVLQNTWALRRRLTEGAEFRGRKVLRYVAAKDTMLTGNPMFFRQRSETTPDDGGLTIMRIPYSEDNVRYQAPYLRLDPSRIWSYVKVQVPDPWGFDLPDNQYVKLRMTYIDDRTILPTDPPGTWADVFVQYDSWDPTPSNGETPPGGVWKGGNANRFAWAPDAAHLNTITDHTTNTVQPAWSVLFPLTGDPADPHVKTIEWCLWRPRFGNRQNAGSDISISIRVPDRTKADPLKVLSVELEADDPSRYGIYDLPFAVEAAKIAAGFVTPTESEFIRHDINQGGPSTDVVDLADALTAIRKATGLE